MKSRGEAYKEAVAYVNSTAFLASSSNAVWPFYWVMSFFDETARKINKQYADLDSHTSEIVKRIAGIYEIGIGDEATVASVVAAIKACETVKEFLSTPHLWLLADNPAGALLVGGIKKAAYIKAMGHAAIAYLAPQSPLS
jgi:hypothetical protein